ncbi:hypothetical protein HK102_000282 [Quaeritorhiza haematococci]|nr:hypothetical protein HK102_000282 [Quaeritorhiza haematococci]
MENSLRLTQGMVIIGSQKTKVHSQMYVSLNTTQSPPKRFMSRPQPFHQERMNPSLSAPLKKSEAATILANKTSVGHAQTHESTEKRGVVSLTRRLGLTLSQFRHKMQGLRARTNGKKAQQEREE